MQGEEAVEGGGRKKLEEFLLARNAAGEVLVFEKSVHSVAEAAEAAGVSHSELIKTIVVSSEGGSEGSNGSGAIFIIPGDRKLSLPKARALLGRGAIRIAKPEEVLRLTGYPAGGVPPVFENPSGLAAFIDSALLQKKRVLGGGGDSRSLLRIGPREIVSIMSLKTGDLCD